MIGKNIALDDWVRKRHGARLAALCQYLEQLSRLARVRAPEVFFLNVLDAQTGDIELWALVQVNPRARQPMRHLVHSWPVGEAPTPAQAKAVAEVLLAECGLSGCLAKCALQYDTDNVHLHVVVCTVDPLSFRMRKAAFLHEALHRACALNEHRFGWRSEPRARYRVQADGTLVRTEASLRPKGACAKSLHERAARLERRTGQRSAQGVAQEVVAALLEARGIDSWAGFHRQLARAGLRYRPVRGGAVIEMHLRSAPVVEVKASSVGSVVTLKVLEQRFGPFTPDRSAVTPRAPQPTARIARSPKRKALWEQYLREGAQLRARRNAYMALRARQQAAVRALGARQFAERRAVLAARRAQGSGSGLPRDVRSALRRVLADDQEQARAALRVAQARERSGRRPIRMPDFDDWFVRLHADLGAELDAARRRGVKPAAQENGLVGTYQAAVPQDLDIHVPFAIADTVLYRHAGRTDFVDQGQRIGWCGPVAPVAVTAAVRVAAQKWPKGFEVRGDHAFIAHVVTAAVWLGVADRITNPELGPMIAEATQRHRQRMAERGEAVVRAAPCVPRLEALARPGRCEEEGDVPAPSRPHRP